MKALPMPPGGQGAEYDVCLKLSRTMLWSITEFVESTKAYSAYICKVPYKRRFVIESEALRDRGGFVSLLFLEEERICADYYDELDLETVLPADGLRENLRRLLADTVETIKSINPNSQVGDALIDFNENSDIAVVQPKGFSLWVSVLVQLIEALYKAICAANAAYSELLLPVLPIFNMDSQLCIGEDTILPLHNRFEFDTFRSVVSLLDKHFISMRTILQFVDMDLASLLHLDLNARLKQKQKKRGAIIIKKAAAMLNLSTRTIEKWESGEINPPANYPGRANLKRFLRWCNDYRTQQILQRETRAKSKPVVNSELLENYLPPTGKSHKSGRVTFENEDR